jgi:CRP/FNR family transcriptional regulator
MQRFIAQVEPFNRLSASQQAALAHVAREQSLAKGQTLFRRGEQADAVWAIKTGRVHLMNYLTDGKASAICVMTPQDLFCCFPAMDGGAYPADAIAMEDSTVVRIPLQAFQKLLDTVPDFTREALCLFCERLRGVEERGCMVFAPVEQRITQVLIQLHEKFGATIPLTRQEIAELAGTTLETAIRTLSRFKQEGIITSTRGSLTVVSLPALQKRLG